MPNLKAETRYKDKIAEVNFNLACIQYIEKKNLHVIYAPALDLYGYRKTVEEAKNSFQITLDEFIRYTVSKKTLTKELKRLGWNVKEGKKKSVVNAPKLDELLRDNKRFSSIWKNKDFKNIMNLFQYLY